MITRFNRMTLRVVLVLGPAVGGAFGGDLNPPAGPVGPTMKTLTEVEPRIAVNATNTPGDAGSVFKITQPGSYYLAGNVTGVASKNGIRIAADNVTLDLNGFALLGVPGSLKGIIVSPGLGSNLAVLNGIIRGWSAGGLDAWEALNARLDGLLASDTGGYGLAVGPGAVVTNCAARENGLSGIFVSSGASVLGCTAALNFFDGIEAAAGSTISNCTSSSNSRNGIGVTMLCRVVGNTCSNNGDGASDGAGIHAISIDNRIDGNHVTGNDRGIDCNPATGNLIIRNSASGNTTNYDIVVGNDAGPTGSAATATSPWANIAF